MYITKQDLTPIEAKQLINSYELDSEYCCFLLLSLEDEDGKCIAQCIVPPDLQAEDVWDDMYELHPEADDFATVDKVHRDNCPLYIADIYPLDFYARGMRMY